MKIYIDAMGGDNAPEAIVLGTVDALRKHPELEVVLGGVIAEIEPHLTEAGDVRSRITLDDAPEVITNHESPVMGVRKKTNSATVRGMLAVRNGEADGFVSAGSTGATLAGGMFRLGRIPGVERPALAPLIPNGRGGFLLIDCGANVDCKPEYLVQFGMMGDAYMRGVMGLKNPRIGLANIGAEEEKGNALAKETFPLMQKASYNFVGNVEARYIPADQADVIVTDGFSGNLILKYTEGLAKTLMGIIKTEMTADIRGKLGGLLCMPAFRRVKKHMDYKEIGGAPLLGVQGAVVKAHGSSDVRSFSSAINQCIKMINGKVVDIIAEAVAKAQAGNEE